MSLDRRGFLGALFGSAVALAILPKLEFEGHALAPEVATDLSGAAWSSTFAAAHREAYLLFKQKMATLGVQAPFMVYPDSRMIGHVTADGTVLTDQRNVGFIILRENQDLSVPYLAPAMDAMTHSLGERGIDRFGTMLLPVGGLYAGQIGPLRMIVQYVLEDDALRPRFDVLGGASPDGQRRAEKFRREQLKTRISRRISKYQRGEPVSIWS